MTEPPPPDTRHRILAAARTAFAEGGYRGATIRAIAASAGVDPALVHHYFDTKAELYAAAISLPIRPAALAAVVGEGPFEEMGRRLATLFFSVWEDADARQPLLAVLQGAMVGNDQGVEAFKDFVETALLPKATASIEGPDASLRVTTAVAHLIGIAILRYVVRLEPIASAPIETVVDMVTPGIQAALTG